MAQQCNPKSSALLKDQVMLLLDLIIKHKVITTKSTNATNNKLKEEAWKSITEAFNASTGDFRRPEQLRLKWENLKKAARKRSANIRQNNLKTGGGKTFISPDECLDRVASILGTTCTGFTVEFGGDQENVVEEATIELYNVEPLSESTQPPQQDIFTVENNGALECDMASGSKATQNQFLFNAQKKSSNRKRKITEEVQHAKRDKDLALAAYFRAKAEKVQLENEKLKIEIQNLKNNN